MSPAQRAAMQAAIEALERIDAWFKARHFVGLVPHEVSTVEALRTALAEPAVETVNIQEAWEAAGGNPGIKATKEELLENLRILDQVCDEADSPPPPAEVPEGSVCARCGGLVFDPVMPQSSGAAQFNAAIDFAITQGLEASDFLDAWRHGDTSEWPEFAQPAEAQPAAARSGVFGYLDGEVRKDMAGFYEAFDRPQPLPPTPRPMSDREWAAQPANLREGCTKHVPGVGDI